MITVAVPFWNRNKVIDRCLESILPELDDEDEIIIVDDASEEVFQSKYIDRIKYIKLYENRGPITARLEAVRESKNKYVVFLDSDDEFISGWRQKIANLVEMNEPDIVYFPIESKIKYETIEITDVKKYWQWVGSDNRAIDYTPLMKRAVAEQILRPLRVSEMWVFVNIYENKLKAIYHNQSICRVNNDAGNQISKSVIKKSFDKYEENSLLYVLKKFRMHKFHMKLYAKKHYEAWRKHLLKRIILSKKVWMMIYLM